MDMYADTNGSFGSVLVRVYFEYVQCPGLFGSVLIRVRVSLFYLKYRHHFSQINVCSVQFDSGLFRVTSFRV